MAISGFHHVAVKAEDFNKSYKFYTELLGMKQVNEWTEKDGRAVMLAMEDDSRIELFEGGKKSTHPNNYGILHIALRTDDPDYYIERVRNAGHTVTMEATDIDMNDLPTGLHARIAFCIGPDDEIIEFFYEK